ncbi:MAG: PLDc N-terminal domain-containing protein [Candidatus Omnitrophica bacterium]|nr:PLDc N-terminal domain-containing protein [Candidatus Omnitrophota bacterium]
MQALIGLIILVLDIVAIVDAWKGTLETGKKILWTVLIIILPIIGLILYFLVGRKKQ